ncbi:hypothetical protein N7494_010686 [Penicillium frequentans]|uniref:Hydrophobin n=1 Tax=Penicillium frequentans TaxID=3151616 RepID=A0AAD6CIC5_9EURO|nr:hypothetical protein N7494_010686 [Penicillium glabrum]
MLVKNILAVFAIAGMATAYPAEDYEYDARGLEERDLPPKCPDGHNWCCQNSVPFSFIFFSGAGSNCVPPSPPKKPGDPPTCKSGTSSLCCQKGQIVSNGKNGAQVVCLK